MVSYSRCEDSSCVCEAGWRGSRCGEKDCDSRCSFHGQCKNGTCLCVAGWNGLHCTLEGCPNGCSNHGSCKANFRGEWSCHCHPGWEGPDCGVRLETRCDDGYDDDQGKLTKKIGYFLVLWRFSTSGYFFCSLWLFWLILIIVLLWLQFIVFQQIRLLFSLSGYFGYLWLLLVYVAIFLVLP